jgi:hypothetical protein
MVSSTIFKSWPARWLVGEVGRPQPTRNAHATDNGRRSQRAATRLVTRSHRPAKMGCGASTAAPPPSNVEARPAPAPAPVPPTPSAGAAAPSSAESLGLEGTAEEDRAAAKMQAVQRGRRGRQKAADTKSEKQAEKELTRAKKKFDQMDKDGNGVIDGTELEELARWMFTSFHPDGQPVPAEVVAKDTKKLTSRLDKDSDGKLSFEEFSAWFTHTCKKISRYRRGLAQKKQAQQQVAPKTVIAVAGAEVVAEEKEAQQQAAPKTDTSATKKRTKGALLSGLRSGELEKAVSKMEEDVAAEEVAVAEKQAAAAEPRALSRGETVSEMEGILQKVDSDLAHLES